MSRGANILVADDDVDLCRMLNNYLAAAGFEVNVAHSKKDLEREISARPMDLVLLDLNMPDARGLDLAREIRAENARIGIIIVTGSGDPIDRIVGLEVGADDFVAKPFDQRELLARIRTLLRRVNRNATGSPAQKVAFDRFVLDLDTLELVDNAGNVIGLTHYEFSLLSLLVRSTGWVLSRDSIMNEITGRDRVVSGRSVDVLIGKLRRKIERDANRPEIIKTVRGAGYKFTSKVERLH